VAGRIKSIMNLNDRIRDQTCDLPAYRADSQPPVITLTRKIKIYRTEILPVLFGCGNCSPTLRQGHRLSVFENMVLGRIFGPKRDEITGQWRRIHNEELHALYSSPNVFG
jgi:hypothetical protein